MRAITCVMIVNYTFADTTPSTLSATEDSMPGSGGRSAGTM